MMMGGSRLLLAALLFAALALPPTMAQEEALPTAPATDAEAFRPDDGPAADSTGGVEAGETPAEEHEPASSEYDEEFMPESAGATNSDKEAEEYATDDLKRMDQDGDRKVTPEEMEAFVKKEWYTPEDLEGHSEESAAQIKEEAAELFAELDKDKDGHLTLEELQGQYKFNPEEEAVQDQEGGSEWVNTPEDEDEEDSLVPSDAEPEPAVHEDEDDAEPTTTASSGPVDDHEEDDHTDDEDMGADDEHDMEPFDSEDLYDEDEVRPDLELPEYEQEDAQYEQGEAETEQQDATPSVMPKTSFAIADKAA